jgi:hypothetical protein
MQKVVINRQYGGFSLSDAAARKLRTMGCVHALKEERERAEDKKNPDSLCQSCGRMLSNHNLYDIARDDPMLVQVVEEMGAEAAGSHATLKVVEIPDGVEFTIEEYDGMEWVAETHRTWR